jgi:hypothetical protein
VTQEAPVRRAGTLSATKFALPPEQPGTVARRRLRDVLDEGAQRPLTLISAPPGAGKTMLLGSWIAAGRPPGPVAWVSLDPADADRRRFWRTVLHALDRAGVGDALAALATRPQARVDRLMAELFAALEAREEPVVLVLDDFHEVAEAVHADFDQQLGLRVTGPQRVLGLQRGDRVHGVGAADRLGSGLGQADVQHLALGHQLGQGADGVLETIPSSASST